MTTGCYFGNFSNQLWIRMVARLIVANCGMFRIVRFSCSIASINISDESTSVVLKSLIFNSVATGSGIMSAPPHASYCRAWATIIRWASITIKDSIFSFDSSSLLYLAHIYSAVAVWTAIRSRAISSTNFIDGAMASLINRMFRLLCSMR